jgi:hypothetical protein
MTEETKTRKPKTPAPFVVGEWDEDDGDAPAVFVPYEKQPPEPITDLAGIVAWTKANYGNKPGTYEFVRRQPGKLTIASETVTKAAFA